MMVWRDFWAHHPWRYLVACSSVRRDIDFIPLVFLCRDHWTKRCLCCCRRLKDVEAVLMFLSSLRSVTRNVCSGDNRQSRSFPFWFFDASSAWQKVCSTCSLFCTSASLRICGRSASHSGGHGEAARFTGPQLIREDPSTVAREARGLFSLRPLERSSTPMNGLYPRKAETW